MYWTYPKEMIYVSLHLDNICIIQTVVTTLNYSVSQIPMLIIQNEDVFSSPPTPTWSLLLPFSSPLLPPLQLQQLRQPRQPAVDLFQRFAPASFMESIGDMTYIAHGDMEVSWIGVAPNHPFNWDFQRYKPTIFGYPHLWNPPYRSIQIQQTSGTMAKLHSSPVPFSNLWMC